MYNPIELFIGPCLEVCHRDSFRIYGLIKSIVIKETKLELWIFTLRIPTSGKLLIKALQRNVNVILALKYCSLTPNTSLAANISVTRLCCILRNLQL